MLEQMTHKNLIYRLKFSNTPKSKNIPGKQKYPNKAPPYPLILHINITFQPKISL